MRDDQESPLLGLPSGVEKIIVSFLSKGKGGLRNVLTLRTVCRTTRSWVDSLPQSDADAVFSNAQVSMDCDHQSLELFNSSPPPFGVTSLCLKSLHSMNHSSQEEEDEWSSFCIWWNPTLESLELHTTAFLFLNPRVSAIMDLENINKIRVIKNLGWHNSPAPLPSSFQKVSELRIKVFDCGNLVRPQFFSLLQSNSNLRVFTFEAESDEDLEGVSQLVDSHKLSSHFQLTLTLPHNLEYSRVFSQLAASILASNSQIRLKTDFKDWMLLHHDVLPLVETISTWIATEKTLSALTSCPRLNEVEQVFNNCISTALLQFPPSLEKLKIYGGFPSSANLTEALKELRVQNFKCDSNQLVASLRNLNGRCPELEELEVSWESSEERDQTLDFEGPAPAFAKLRRLSLIGKLLEEDVAYLRVGVANAFDWRGLEIHYIQVEFNHPHPKCQKLPLLNEEILRKLLEGPSAKSLLKVEIDDKCVTADAVPMLQLLRSLVAQNWERRLEAEGPGVWQRHFQYF